MGQNVRSLIKRHYRGLIWDSFIHFVQLLKLLGTVDLDTARTALCYARTGHSSRREVSLSGVGSGSSARATCDANMW